MDESSFKDLERNTRLVYKPFEEKGLLVVVELTQKPAAADGAAEAVATARWASGIRTAAARGLGPEEAWEDKKLWLEPGGAEARGLPGEVRAADVRLMEPAEYWIGYQPKTADDRAAIALPDAFVATECGFSWDRIQDKYKEKKLSHPYSGMQAILDYRWWITERLLNSVKPMTSLRVRRLRTELLPRLKEKLKVDWLEEVEESEWIRTANDMSWGMPGSVEPTSDIDLNSWNDGTEWAVRGFNSAFQSLHDGRESGTVFDVNLYAQDFKPGVKRVKGQQPTPDAKPLAPDDDRPLAGRPYQWPDRGHEYQTEVCRAADAREQETVSILHLRRHAPDSFWTTYKELAQANPMTAEKSPGIAQAEHRQGTNQQELEQARKLLDEVLASREQKLDAAALGMAAENRLYEVRLGRVERAKQEFDFALFALKLAKIRAVEEKLSKEKLKRAIRSTDEAFFKLKELRSRAVYFANESYATAGSLVQVVAGKQELSRGVARRKKRPSAYNNIAYTADELLHSLNEQVGFIFHAAMGVTKAESAEELASADLYKKHIGKFLIKASKYLHRLFNALKHLYFIYYHVGETAGVRDREWTRGWPVFLHDDPREYEKIRRACGYGVEELKKFNPAPPATDPYIVDPGKTPNDVAYLAGLSDRLCLAEVSGDAAMAVGDGPPGAAVARATLDYLVATKPEGVARQTYEVHFKKLRLEYAEGATFKSLLDSLLQIAVSATADCRRFSEIPLRRETHQFPYWLKDRKSRLTYPYPVPAERGQDGGGS